MPVNGVRKIPIKLNSTARLLGPYTAIAFGKKFLLIMAEVNWRVCTATLQTLGRLYSTILKEMGGKSAVSATRIALDFSFNYVGRATRKAIKHFVRTVMSLRHGFVVSTLTGLRILFVSGNEEQFSGVYQRKQNHEV